MKLVWCWYSWLRVNDIAGLGLSDDPDGLGWGWWYSLLRVDNEDGLGLMMLTCS